MPEEAPPYSSCGTHAAGWLNGAHPDSGSAVVNVCYHWTPGECWQNNDITVTNCGDYYVYLLSSPPGCSYKYCGEDGPSLTPTNKPTMMPTKEEKGTCYSAKTEVAVRASRETTATVVKRLADVKVGDQILKVGPKAGARDFATIVGLPHSPTSQSSFDIKMAPKSGGLRHTDCLDRSDLEERATQALDGAAARGAAAPRAGAREKITRSGQVPDTG